MHGSGTLVRWLLANELVDEMTPLVVPVVVGQGTGLPPRRAARVRTGPGASFNSSAV